MATVLEELGQLGAVWWLPLACSFSDLTSGPQDEWALACFLQSLLGCWADATAAPHFPQMTIGRGWAALHLEPARDLQDELEEPGRDEINSGKVL